MLAPRWIVRRGREGAWRYLRVLGPSSVAWVGSEAEAERFATKADAIKVAVPLSTALAVEVAIYPRDGVPA